MCNNAVIHADTLLGQPTEGALLAAGMKVLCCCHVMMHYTDLEGQIVFKMQQFCVELM